MTDLLELRVKSIIKETEQAITIVLEPLGAFHYQPGQFLTLLIEVSGRELRRLYSFSSTPDIDPFPAITIKRVPNGEVSRFLFDHLREGQHIKVLRPAGRFVLQEQKDEWADIFLFAAGSGITPVFSILKDLLFNKNKMHVKLFYSNKNESSAIFYQQIKKLQKQFPERLKVFHFFSYTRHRLNNYTVEKLVNRELSYSKKNARFFICGPLDYMRMIKMMVIYMAFPKENVKMENFVIPPLRNVKENRQVSTVLIEYLQKHYTIEVLPGKTILQAALEHDIELPYSCRGGTCSTCIAHLIQGKVEMLINEVLMDEDINNGLVLTCTGIPQSPEVKIAFDE